MYGLAVQAYLHGQFQLKLRRRAVQFSKLGSLLSLTKLICQDKKFYLLHASADCSEEHFDTIIYLKAQPTAAQVQLKSPV